MKIGLLTKITGLSANNTNKLLIAADQTEVKLMEKSNENFDIIYLNLDKYKDRNEHMIKLLNKANCEYSRFEAVDGIGIIKKEKTFRDYCKKFNLENIPELKDYNDIDLKYLKYAGLIGCKLSHYLILRIIENSETSRPVLIFEDDIDLECDFMSEVEEGLKELPEDWDILILNSAYKISDSEYNESSKKTVNVRRFYETSSFIVNGSKTAKKIADCISGKCPSHYLIDTFLCEMTMLDLIKVYSFRKKLAIQKRDLFKSSILGSDNFKPEFLENSLMDSI